MLPSCRPLLLVALLSSLLLTLPRPLLAQPRRETLLDTGWKFSRGDVPGAAAAGFDDKKWPAVRVPHDWAIAGPFSPANDPQAVRITQNHEATATLKAGRTGGLPFVGVGWYRRVLPAGLLSGMGARTVLLFDGAMSNARVFVNGREAGAWPYGYNSFTVDVSALLNPRGPNVLAVRLENLPEASRWYPGAGLYRNVHLISTQGAHVPVWGTVVTTPVVAVGAATVRLRTAVAGPASGALRLQTKVREAGGRLVAQVSTSGQPGQTEFRQLFEVKNPRRWSPESPALYVAESKLYAGAKLLDTYSTRFGIRSVAFRAGQGFFLNEQRRQFHGVCLHHDLGPLGAAVSRAALRRQLLLLKEMGCDAVRTTHNMPAPELVSLCDELGLLLIVEAFDEWQTGKMKNGYHRLFDEWAARDLQNMVRRDRNHPSVVLWSVGNEVPDQGTATGPALARRLQDVVHQEDSTRLVTCGMDQLDAALKNGFAAVFDLPGFNYKPHRYAEALPQLPQGLLYGSETASTVSSRGVYKFPAVAAKDRHYPDLQSSSYDLEACEWSQTPDEEFVGQDDVAAVAGEFVWTGFDYLGEPTPYDATWPAHSSYFGIFDLAGLPKDRYYLYRARWNPTRPTLHLLPHWTWPGREGQPTPVFAYTNSPSAELFVNGVSQGRQTKAPSATPQTRYRLLWPDVKYAPGSLKIVAYDAQGKAVATQEVKTAGAPHHIRLVADRTALAADGKDMAFITARVEDAQGNLCPDAAQSLRFAVSGAGSFRAIANGDATNLESFQRPQMRAFQGQLVAIVQAGDKAGAVQVKASGTGLQAGTVTLQTKAH